MKYSYRCIDCSTIVIKELRLSDYTDSIECECGGTCTRAILAPPVVSLDPISGDFVGSTEKWIKHREQKMKQERHNMKEHGTYT